MAACNICLDALKLPVALPCGHVFCHECIVTMVGSIIPYTSRHCCPSCRGPYSIVNVDPNIVPAHLRPNLLPSLRRLYLDEAPAKDNDICHELAKLRMENASLRTQCEAWRSRANYHHASAVGFAGLVKIAREYAIRVKSEKDEMELEYNLLKRKCEEGRPSLSSTSTTAAPSTSLHNCEPLPPSAQDLTNSYLWLNPEAPTIPVYSTSPPPAKRIKRDTSMTSSISSSFNLPDSPLTLMFHRETQSRQLESSL